MSLPKAAIPHSDSALPPERSLHSPDWAVIDRDVLCPLCDYNLRGLTEPRCPECGYQFEWPTVLDPKLQIHPYLFEVHPERNVRSFLQTLVRNFHPGSLWKTLQPSHRSNTRRLIVYGSICSIIAMLPSVLLIAGLMYTAASNGRPRYSMAGLLNSVMSEDMVQITLTLCIIWAVFPWLNFLSLLVFGQSMRRARVKPVHVLRCAIYCADVIVWNALIALAVVGWYLAGGQTYRDDRMMAEALAWAGLAFALINAIRLVFAYWYYMRFRHVIATIVASQLIVLFAIQAGVVIVKDYILHV